ncbi:MAG TPA: UbiH/UbiF family hydroxylase [Burkholderiales bacterium]|nr:UbiH/UbiF family hydroxylase [Burkholderiales bacterium]
MAIQSGMRATQFDVLIAGGGLVGLSLARALAGSGLRLGLVERDPVPAPSPETWDVRVFAISPGSEAFLTALGAWPRDAARMTPITHMSIFGDRAGSELSFSAYLAHVPHLAIVVENAALVGELRDALRGQPEFAHIASTGCSGVQFEPDRAVLTLDSGDQLTAKLMVAADGADSWLRGRAGIASSQTGYGQTAVVANFATALAHRGSAFQWFRTDGVLALLPLPGERASMVWSARQDLADRLLALPAEQLCDEVHAASGGRLGALSLITPAAGFVLRLIRVDRLVAPRLALVGDAAHNLHPLAGQGVNLGFQDARELASVLKARGPEADVGCLPLLRRYERARREDILAMTAVTHGLQRLFNNSVAPLAWLRNVGLSLTDHLTPLKALLVKHALGAEPIQQR